jgi:hypothetical protein
MALSSINVSLSFAILVLHQVTIRISELVGLFAERYSQLICKTLVILRGFLLHIFSNLIPNIRDTVA